MHLMVSTYYLIESLTHTFSELDLDYDSYEDLVNFSKFRLISLRSYAVINVKNFAHTYTQYEW